MANRICALCAHELNGKSNDGSPLVTGEVCDNCYYTRVILEKLDQELRKMGTLELDYDISIKGIMNIYISDSLQGWMVRIEAHDNEGNEVTKLRNNVTGGEDNLAEYGILGTQWIVEHIYEIVLDNDSYYADDFVIEYYHQDKFLDKPDLLRLESDYYDSLEDEEEAE